MTLRKTIAVIEPNASHFGLIEKALAGKSFILKRAHSWQEAAPLFKKIPHLILTESPPDDLGWITKTSRLHPQVPIIVLSTVNDNSRMIKAIQRGASDYWIKNRETLSGLPGKISKALRRKKSPQKSTLPSPGNLERILGNLSRITEMVNESGRKLMSRNSRASLMERELGMLRDLLKKLHIPL